MQRKVVARVAHVGGNAHTPGLPCRTQHKIVHSASRHTRPIVTSLFQELTLLGFVGLFLFLVEQSGLLQTLSAAAFGEGWEGLLVVHFHQIHMILFLVMVVYLATVLLLMRVGLRLTRVWRVMEEEAHFRERLMQKYAKERMEAEKKEIMNARAPSSRSLSRKGTMMGKALKSGLTQAAGRGAKKLSAHDSVLYSSACCPRGTATIHSRFSHTAFCLARRSVPPSLHLPCGG